MAEIKITCDSACDLPAALLQRYRITELPLEIRMGSDLCRDRIDVMAPELYDYSEKTGKLPGICSVSPERYRQFFQKLTADGSQVLHISLSGKISVCYQHALEAARHLPQVAVVDSQSLSSGVGQLALLAAELASADYRLQELTDALDEMKQHMDVSCVLQSSSLLHRSGNKGGLTALGEHLLHLKPELCLKNGQIRHEKPLRGDLETSILSYVRNRLEGKHNIHTDRIFITYSAVPRSILDKVRELLQQLQPFEQILEIPASSAVSCRCGPGSLGLAFMTS